MPSIDLKKLKQIIREEVALVREGDDHDAAAKIVSSSAKLLKAIEAFKGSISEKVKADLGGHLEEVEKVLNRIVAPAVQHVDATKPPEKKVVTLKPAAPKTL